MNCGCARSYCINTSPRNTRSSIRIIQNFELINLKEVGSGGFRVGNKLSGALKKFKNKGKPTEADVRGGCEIKTALPEADQLKVVRDGRVTERARFCGT